MVARNDKRSIWEVEAGGQKLKVTLGCLMRLRLSESYENLSPKRKKQKKTWIGNETSS